MQVLAVHKQIRGIPYFRTEADRSACGVVVVPDWVGSVGLENHFRSFQNVIRGGSVHRFGSSDSVRIIGVADAVRAVARGGQLSSALPGEGIAVVVLQRVADRVIGEDVYWNVRMSGTRIQRALNKWKVDALPDDLYRFMDIDDPDLSLILKAFGIEIPPKLYRRAELKAIKTGTKVFK